MVLVRSFCSFQPGQVQMAPLFIRKFIRRLCKSLTTIVKDNGPFPTAGCYEALGDEKVASASESADNECCIGDEDAVDILMSLRGGAMRVSLTSDAVAVCVTHMLVTEAKLLLSGLAAA